MAYELKRGDRRPYFRVQLLVTDPASPPDLIPCDLTDAASVKFLMGKIGDTLVVNAAGTFIDKPTGVVQYAWDADDTIVSGAYKMEVEVNWGGSETQSFPSTGFYDVTITDDLG
jgi:hypothetical protein